MWWPQAVADFDHKVAAFSNNSSAPPSALWSFFGPIPNHSLLTTTSLPSVTPNGVTPNGVPLAAVEGTPN